jgi:tryptophanyl-tRNA synthetase
MNKQTILSGVQPSGKLHIGNYLGALTNFIELQNSGKYNCYYCIVDLHSLTQDYEPKQKRQQVLELAADFLAAGLDPKKSTIFVQSHVPEHSELAWIFSTITPVGELSRMTQYKDKSQRQETNINVGLFTYPILQAADILCYKPAAVPIGIDQKQHLELANSITKKFNNKFGRTFTEIKPIWTKFPKVMDLKHPDKKMSKSDPSGCVFLDDSPAEIKAKLAKAVTASEAGKKSPGVENLFLLLEHFGTQEEIAFFRDQQRSDTLKFSELKETLAKEIALYFEAFREKKKELLSRPEYLAEILGEGSKKAREVASRTLLEVKEKIGLL